MCYNCLILAMRMMRYTCMVIALALWSAQSTISPETRKSRSGSGGSDEWGGWGGRPGRSWGTRRTRTRRSRCCIWRQISIWLTVDNDGLTSYLLWMFLVKKRISFTLFSSASSIFLREITLDVYPRQWKIRNYLLHLVVVPLQRNFMRPPSMLSQNMRGR